MARAFLMDEAKNDVRVLVADDEQIAHEGLRIVKELQANAYMGDRLREKANLKPLAQADCRKVKFDHPHRRATAKPRYRYRLIYRIEPHEGSPETVVVMALGVKPQAYRDATARAAKRMHEQAQTRRTQS